MSALDRYFVDLVRANPQLRARVGNPDELASNRLGGVLKALKHRVSQPESELESVHGAVITVLNEEAVVSACLANQGGLNLVASYEAFCVKMLGAVRQSLIFARQQKEVGRPAGWLGWPLVATSHTWENGKNQQSHQDTTFCEALLGEMHDVMRVLLPADHNSLLALLPGIYQERGRLACVVVAKREQPCSFTAAQAQQLARDGALLVAAEGEGEPVLLIASGSYQLHAMRRAAVRLSQHAVAWRLIYLQEPGRFRGRVMPGKHRRWLRLQSMKRCSPLRTGGVYCSAICARRWHGAFVHGAGRGRVLSGTGLSQPWRHLRRGRHAVRQWLYLGACAAECRRGAGHSGRCLADGRGTGCTGRHGRSQHPALNDRVGAIAREGQVCPG